MHTFVPWQRLICSYSAERGSTKRFARHDTRVGCLAKNFARSRDFELLCAPEGGQTS